MNCAEGGWTLSRSMDETEVALITKCRQGDRQSFNRLVMNSQNLVYSFLYRLAPKWDDLDDLAQEVFVKVYHSIKDLKDVSQFKSWLHRIAVTVYLDELRRRKKRQERFVSDEALLDTHTEPDAHPERDLARKELRGQLQRAIDRLPEEFKVAIVLREIQGLSYEESATALGISIGTVRSRLFRGRKLLREMLKAQL
ncbi:MAG: sigma-70 family RNA polymerase sigma factor [bacterium]|nr:sigma-70 family RNA polymerase sigma factor [bacterium]